jgi:hypothetical protein
VTQPGGSGDLIGDFQRWLLRSGARGMSRELADQVRAALGKNQSTGDVWETATTQPVPADAPECAWCPLCRAARIVREAKPGRDKRVAAVGDALTTVVQDAVSVLEAALAATGRSAGGNGRTEAGPGTRGYPAAGAAGKAAPAPGGQATAPAPGGEATTPASGGQAPASADGPAASKEATTPAPGGQAPASADGPAAGPGGQAAVSADVPAAPGTDGPAAADTDVPAAPGTDGPAAAGTDGPAAADTEGHAAPEPPEESPHEPDDRG